MKFQVGDKVAAYLGSKKYVGMVNHIDDRREPHMVVVETETDTLSFHPKQCRRLVKKKRREIWVDPDFNCFLESENEGWIRFVEAKEKE